jgi:hypothetical protein
MSNAAANTTRREQVEQSLDRASQLFGLMGRIVTAGVPSHVEVPVEDLREMVGAAGLGFEIPENREKSALTRALKAMEQGGMVEEVDNVPGVKLVYALMMRRKDEDSRFGVNRMGYSERYLVAYYYGGVPEELRTMQVGPEPMIFFCEDRRGDPREAERALRPLIERYRQVYVSRQIQEHIVLNALYRADAFPMHPRGLYYYVAKANEDVIGRLRAFMDLLDAWLAAREDDTGARCMLRYINVPDAPEDQEQVSAAAMDLLLGEMNDIRVDLRERKKNPDKVRQGTERSEGTADKLEKRINALLAKAGRIGEIGEANLAKLATTAEQLRRDARSLQKAAVVVEPEAERGRRAEAEVAAPVPAEGEGARGSRAEVEAPVPAASSRRRRAASSAPAAKEARAARG